MNSCDSQTEPKKKSRRFYLVLVAVVVLLAVIVGVVLLDYIGRTTYGPGPVEIEVTTDKPFYLQGEEVNFTIYVNNPQSWPVPEPSGAIHEMNSNGNLVFSGNTITEFVPSNIALFPAHSKTLYETRVWDGKVGSSDNRTMAPPGIYTFTVTFGGLVDYGNSGNCTFEIRPN